MHIDIYMSLYIYTRVSLSLYMRATNLNIEAVSRERQGEGGTSLLLMTSVVGDGSVACLSNMYIF